MFYGHEKGKWESGLVIRVLPALGYGNSPTFRVEVNYKMPIPDNA